MGMGKDLYEAYADSRRVFDRAEEILGFPLKKFCFEGPAEELKPTDVSQPAIFTVTLAAFEAFKARTQVTPAFVAGLSLGEYTALTAAGALSFEESVALVRKRGALMEAASRKAPGAMSAVLGLTLEKVEEVCRAEGAEIANINTPEQIVISGSVEAVARAEAACARAGAKRAVRLEVSGGFHSSLMRDASEELRAVLEGLRFSDSGVPVVSNVTARSHSAAQEIRDNLVRQMYSPVRWVESIRFLAAAGTDLFVEFGPGKVLKGLLRRIEPSLRAASIETAQDIENFVKEGVK